PRHVSKLHMCSEAMGDMSGSIASLYVFNRKARRSTLMDEPAHRRVTNQSRAPLESQQPLILHESSPIRHLRRRPSRYWMRNASCTAKPVQWLPTQPGLKTWGPLVSAQCDNAWQPTVCWKKMS